MNKFAKLIIAAVVFAVVATAGSYFIKQTRPLFLLPLPPPANCAVNSPQPDQPTPAQTDRGFPAYYEQRLPQLVVHDKGCSYSINYHTQFSWRHAGIDLLEWGVIGLLVIYLIERLRSMYIVEVKKPSAPGKNKKSAKGAKRG